MSKEELIAQLKLCQQDRDTECAHIRADELLIEFINDDEIEAAYNKVSKWYA
jgi:hypothetical protein